MKLKIQMVPFFMQMMQSNPCRLAPEFYENTFFNQPLSNWDIEPGSDVTKNGALYPYRVFGTGSQANFVVVLRSSDTDIEYLCSGAVHGFSVTFHPPNELPKLSESGFVVSSESSALFRIIPKLMITSPSLHRYSSDVRRCYFKLERRLRFFKVFTVKSFELNHFS